MSELATMARPYAAAVFKRAKEKSSAEFWSTNLSFLSLVMANKDMLALVSNPKIEKTKLTELMLSLADTRLDQEGINFLRLLVNNNRLTLIPYIAELFEEFKAEDEGYVDVEVVTAYALSKEAKDKLLTKLAKKLDKKIHMNVIVDKLLIGGVLIRAGDRVIDGSIRGQLQNLHKALQ